MGTSARQIEVLPYTTIAVEDATSAATDTVYTPYFDIGGHDFSKKIGLIVENWGTSADFDVAYQLGYKLPGIRDSWIEDPTFVGSGLDDLTNSGHFEGQYCERFRVQIDATGTPDTFKWTRKPESGTWEAETVECSTSAQELEDGIFVTWAANTGHVVGEYWYFDVSDVHFTDLAAFGALSTVNAPKTLTNLPAVTIGEETLDSPAKYIRFSFNNDAATDTAILRAVMTIQT